ncbi:MAG TPA: tRNA uridine-5-carboxymethylaminomethyl(34) synthesis GTPase MnmE [Candidatus Binatia bacterium]|jgi:tRNA modification GTPase|nr:tRNA uridine-5-carboxymethylaminomethyl(34) synthesis GTPase MnmE [Candidatus Binatia bacterium]
MYKEDTIAAIATPIGEGGVAIVRVSGPDAERVAKEIFLRSGGRNGHLRSHTLHHGVVRKPETGGIVDEVLLALMRKPRSYTGEDVVEVHCHGGPFVVRQVLELILSRGVRHAEPGEFTKRAFLNGRMDLAQAEAVLDLIRARTEKSAQLALQQTRGQLSKWVGELREELLDILVQIEAGIDFPEEEIELVQREELAEKIEGLRAKISGIIESYEWGRLFREGARVCIIGRPNVGKSSLLNALLGEERVIVTSVPGTTRDVIEEGINLDGLPVVLWDTAGIRETEDEIEKIGVDFSLRHLVEAEAALIVLDGSTSLTRQDEAILEAAGKKKSLVVVNKSDLGQNLDLAQVQILSQGKEMIPISARKGEGLDLVKVRLRALLLDPQNEPPMVLTNLRHKAALIRAESGLIRARKALGQALPAEIVAVDLQEVKDALEDIVGMVSSEDILERIFTSFCIGK